MRRLLAPSLARAAVRLSWIVPAALLSACQVVAPQPAPAPRLLVDDAAAANAVVPVPTQAAAVPTTYAIKRDTLRESLALPGKVVPMRSTQLAFRGTGTVLAVNVAPGQRVEEG